MLFKAFNFDMLKALVEEMNRYNESPHEALKMLNAKPFSDKNCEHKVEILVNGKRIERGIYPKEIDESPLMRSSFDIEFYPPGDDDNDEQKTFHFTSNDVKHVDGDNGSVTYTNSDGITAIFTRVKSFVYDYSKAF